MFARKEGCHLKVVIFSKLLRQLKRNHFFYYLNSEKNRLISKMHYYCYSDTDYIRKLYKKSFGVYPDIECPSKFSEKLQWLKINYRIPDMSICADKYKVREYLSSIGYSHILNEIYGTYHDANEIDTAKLPDKFVLKATHGSGWNIVCKNKNNFKLKAWKKVLCSWLRQNYYYYGREWPYNQIKPLLICEKYLETHSGVLYDYKFYCFNGKVEFIKSSDDMRVIPDKFYDTSWVLKDERYSTDEVTSTAIPKPINLREMITIAEDLAKMFPFVRVDLYDVDGKIVFGEMTFYPTGGFLPFYPESYDKDLGDKLNLPQINNSVKKVTTSP